MSISDRKKEIFGSMATDSTTTTSSKNDRKYEIFGKTLKSQEELMAGVKLANGKRLLEQQVSDLGTDNARKESIYQRNYAKTYDENKAIRDATAPTISNMNAALQNSIAQKALAEQQSAQEKAANSFYNVDRSKYTASDYDEEIGYIEADKRAKEWVDEQERVTPNPQDYRTEEAYITAYDNWIKNKGKDPVDTSAEDNAIDYLKGQKESLEYGQKIDKVINSLPEDDKKAVMSDLEAYAQAGKKLAELKRNEASFYNNPNEYYDQWDGLELEMELLEARLKGVFGNYADSYDTKEISGYEYSSDKAQQLLDFYGRQITAKEAELIAEQDKKLVKSAPVVTNLATIVAGLIQFTDVPQIISDAIKDIPVDTNALKVTNFKDNVRQETAKEYITSNFMNFIYQTGMSMGDFLIMMPLNSIGAGEAVTLALMGTNAGISAAKEATERGLDSRSALATGLLAGVFEALFEKVSIEALLKPGESKSKIGYILKNFLAEGSEEVATDIANGISDYLINGGLSELNSRIAEYQKAGKTLEEARKLAFTDNAWNMVQSFAGGALSGGVLGAFSAVFNPNVKAQIEANKNNIPVGQVGKLQFNKNFTEKEKQDPQKTGDYILMYNAGARGADLATAQKMGEASSLNEIQYTAAYLSGVQDARNGSFDTSNSSNKPNTNTVNTSNVEDSMIADNNVAERTNNGQSINDSRQRTASVDSERPSGELEENARRTEERRPESESRSGEIKEEPAVELKGITYKTSAELGINTRNKEAKIAVIDSKAESKLPKVYKERAISIKTIFREEVGNNASKLKLKLIAEEDGTTGGVGIASIIGDTIYVNVLSDKVTRRVIRHEVTHRWVQSHKNAIKSFKMKLYDLMTSYYDATSAKASTPTFYAYFDTYAEDYAGLEGEDLMDAIFEEMFCDAISGENSAGKYFWRIASNVYAKENNISKVTESETKSEAKHYKSVDEEYSELSKSPDKNEKRLREIIDKKAEESGYSSNSDYQGTSAFNGTAPSSNGYFGTKEERLNAWKNGKFDGDASLGDYKDGIDINNLEWILNDPRAIRNEFIRESVSNLKKGLKNGTITMYRSVPNSVKETKFRNGDWVTPSRLYAIDNAEVHSGYKDWDNGYKIIEQNVSIEDIWWDGNDINEWGYDDGKEYKYSNTENNIKLNDLVTYDENGNVIPLNKRFDSGNSDPRYYKEIDGKYMELAKEPDKNKSELNKMVAIAANNAGYSEEVYHGTTAEKIFNTFIAGGGQYGNGVYFTYDKDVAKEYSGNGGRVLHLFVKLSKVADFSDVYKTLGSDNFENYDEFAQSLGFDNFDDMLNSGNEDPTNPEYNKDLVKKLIDNGFDGFVDEGNGGFVLWDIPGYETRIKSADPVTYDDNGNIIPLSERFNSEKDDIRYYKEVKPRAAIDQRNQGYMLDSKKFYSLYSVHKLNIGNRFDSSVENQIDEIKRNGFKSSTSISNVLPASTMSSFNYNGVDEYNQKLQMENEGIIPPGSAEKVKDRYGKEYGKVKYDNVIQARYAPKKGEYVLFVPNTYVTKDDIIKNGFKPLDYEIARVEYDNQPYYELYKNNYESLGLSNFTTKNDIRHYKNVPDYYEQGVSTEDREELYISKEELSKYFLDEWHTTRTETAKRLEENMAKKKETALADLNSLIQELRLNFQNNHVLEKGTSSRRILGVYNRGNKSIRIRYASDLATFAHELGHSLDNVLSIAMNNENIGTEIKKELKRSYLETFSETDYKAEKHYTEGFAEYFKRYLINNEITANEYPEITKMLYSKLSPKELQALEVCADKVNLYLSEGFLTRPTGIISHSDNVPDYRSVKTKASSALEKIYQDWVSSTASLSRIDKEYGTKLKLMSETAPYASARVAEMFNSNVLFDYDGYEAGTGFATALADINLKDKQELADFDEYLVCWQALDMIPQGMDVWGDQRKNTLAFNKERIKMLDQKYSKFRKSAERVWEFMNRFTRVWGVDTGLIERSALNNWMKKYPHYVPLNRVKIIGTDYEANKGNTGIKSARNGALNQTSTIKARKGGTEAIYSPIENIMYRMASLVNASTNNKIGEALYKLAKRGELDASIAEIAKAPVQATKIDGERILRIIKRNLEVEGYDLDDIDVISDAIGMDFGKQYGRGRSNKENLVFVMHNGKAKWLQINDMNVFRALTNIQPKRASGFLGVYGKVSKFMTTNITGMNLIWSLVSNMPRDFGTFVMYSPTKNPFGKNGFLAPMIHGLKNNLGNGATELIDFIGETFFDKEGGKNEKFLSSNPNYRLFLAMGGGSGSSINADRNMAKEAINKLGKNITASDVIFGPIEFLSETIESGPRFAAFELALKSGLTPQEAFLASREITTNFARGGIYGRQVNKAVPFFNAGVQGMDRFVRYLTADDISNISQRKKTVVSRFSGFVATSLITAAISSALNLGGDDDDKDAYNNLSSFVKNSYWTIPIGDGKYWAIPKPREIAILSSTFERLLEQWLNGNEHAFDGFFDYVTDNILPNAVSEFVQGLPDPVDATMSALGALGAIGVLSNLGRNKDFLGRPIVSESMQNLESKAQYNANTSKIAYWLGQTDFANNANISPLKIDYFMQNVLGGWWKYQKALLPVDMNKQDLTLGVGNQLTKDSLYSTDIVNWLYDNASAFTKKFNSNKTGANAVRNQINNAYKSFYSYYNNISKNENETNQTRATRRDVLELISDYRTSLEANVQTDAQKLVYGAIEELYGKDDSILLTNYLPKALNPEVKLELQNGETQTINLNTSQYYEYQSTYNGYYWKLVAGSMNESMSYDDKILTISKIQAMAQNLAKEFVASTYCNVHTKYYSDNEDAFKQNNFSSEVKSSVQSTNESRKKSNAKTRFEVAVNNKNYTGSVSAIKEYMLLIDGDDSDKRSSASSLVTSAFKKTYKNATNAERSRLKKEILKIYKAIYGDDYSEKKSIKKIDAWLEEDK